MLGGVLLPLTASRAASHQQRAQSSEISTVPLAPTCRPDSTWHPGHRGGAGQAGLCFPCPIAVSQLRGTGNSAKSNDEGQGAPKLGDMWFF